MKLTDSQKRNLVLVYLFPFNGTVNGNTFVKLKELDLVEAGWTKDPRTPYERCTAKGKAIAEKLLKERLDAIGYWRE